MSNSTLYSCTNCGLRVGERKSSAIDPPSSAALDALSKNNDPPPPLEYHLLKQRYLETQSRVTSLDGQVLRLQNSLRAVLAEKKRLMGRLQVWKGPLHPIRRLPDDILAYMFQTCVDRDLEAIRSFDPSDDARYPGTLDTSRAPWCLGQVCKRWRSLTLSLPKLWTNFDIGWKYTDVYEYQPQLEPLLALQLQRCRDLPLTVSYCGEEVDDSEPYRSNQRFLMVLCSRSFQWEDVTVRGDSLGLNHLLPYKGLFPSLRQLHLYLEEDDWDDSVKEAFIFEDSPNLTRLTITGAHGAFTSSSTQLPWTQITHYTSKEFDDPQYELKNDVHFRLLPNMPNLEVCVLDCVDVDDQIDELVEAPWAPLKLSLLRTLVLTCGEPTDSEPSSIGQLLDWLVLPNLRCLRLLGGFRAPTSLIGLLERSSCTLRELEIIDTRLDRSELLQLVGSNLLREISTFTIGKFRNHSSTSISDVLLKRFKHVFSGKQKSIVLPKLQHLVLHGTKRWSDEVLLDVVASRRDLGMIGTLAGSITRLESLTVRNAVLKGKSSIVSQAAGERLRVMQQGGFIFENQC
ncbi:hypothetical protein VNI00_006810 [Paramarasmius palmivorus]|uniref:F-box domain-containing protein n=1 Tax=Paramarasmius palmivorus TaxID=297713 RepID=A0AAW0D8U1_9AGAR